MSRFELDKLTWEDVEELDKAKTLVFLPVSPVEEHGPHLPLGTDLYAASDIAGAGIEILEKEAPDLNYVLYPGIPLGCADITADFPGTISVKGNTLMRVIVDVSAALAKSGFKFIIIVNHHYDLSQIKAISTAMDKVKKEFNIGIFEPLGTFFFSTETQPAAPIPTEDNIDMSQQAHAEFEETSFIKYKYPELLKDSYRSLPPVYIDLVKHYLIGQRTIKKMGAARGYVGSPSKATAEYGKSYLEEKSRLLADSALKLYHGENLPQLSLKIRLALKLLRLS